MPFCDPYNTLPGRRVALLGSEGFFAQPQSLVLGPLQQAASLFFVPCADHRRLSVDAHAEVCQVAQRATIPLAWNKSAHQLSRLTDLAVQFLAGLRHLPHDHETKG